MAGQLRQLLAYQTLLVEAVTQAFLSRRRIECQLLQQVIAADPLTLVRELRAGFEQVAAVAVGVAQEQSARIDLDDIARRAIRPAVRLLTGRCIPGHAHVTQVDLVRRRRDGAARASIADDTAAVGRRAHTDVMSGTAFSRAASGLGVVSVAAGGRE